MKRLGIYVFYDKSGIADKYIEVLLENMQKMLHKLIFIVNGKICAVSRHNIEQYVSEVYLRTNYGYDAGAYKDAFLQLLDDREWKDYDELILMNNSFFGPFFPLQDLWDHFDEKDIDFWGITRHPEGCFENGKEFNSHIQAYFLVIKRKMLNSEKFLQFWKEMPYPDSYQMAVEEFEIKFTHYFEKLGFCGRTFMDEWVTKTQLTEQCNPYLYYSGKMIKELHMPFLKKKCLQFESGGYGDAINALAYIDKELDYNIQYIWEHIWRLNQEQAFGSSFNYCRLEDFYHAHQRIFIYGAGQYGQAMMQYFQYRGWKMEAFIVTSGNNHYHNIKEYDSIIFTGNDGIILALGRKNLREVLEKIQKDFSISHLFIPDIAKDQGGYH